MPHSTKVNSLCDHVYNTIPNGIHFIYVFVIYNASIKTFCPETCYKSGLKQLWWSVTLFITSAVHLPHLDAIF